MSENTPYTPGPDASQPPSRWEEREARREARREAHGERRWIWGAILILLGVIFLLQNAGIFLVNNWWALFILIPAFGAFAAAWETYRGAGNRLTAGARGSAIGGFILLLVAAAFLFNFNWTFFWPLLIILAGIALLSNALLPS